MCRQAGETRWDGGAAALAVVVCACSLLLAHASAQVAPIGPANGDFEGGATGWSVDAGTLAIDASQPVNGGGASGHVRANASGTVTLRSQWWLTAATPGNKYDVTLALRIPAATITAVTARIDLVDGSGVALTSNAASRPGPTSGYVTLTVAPATAPPGTAFAMVVVSGVSTAAGARFSVDDVVITQTIVPPPPVFEEPAPSSDDSTPVTPAIGRGEPIRLPAVSAAPKPAPLSTRLLNGAFDTDMNGWNVARGRAWIDAVIPGQGSSMVLYAQAAGTVWAEQTIGEIKPGEWYQASALLSTRGVVDAGWLRVSWYATDNAIGAPITFDDSVPVDAIEAAPSAAAPHFQVVGTGTVRAPGGAHSAIVRVLLRSNYGEAWLIVDNVGFSPAADPDGTPPRAPTISSTPVPGATAGTPSILRGAFAGVRPATTPAPAGPSSRSSAVPPARATTTPRAVVIPTATPSGLRVENVVTAGLADGQRAFRITQLLPNPANPGRDDEFEWVEVSNLGVTAASLEGMSLRDNSGSVTLPALVVPAGGTVVVTSRLAEVPGVTAFRLAQAIGNGLGNAGDRLVLAGADGRPVDAFSYGEDTTYLQGARIPAPGTGRAIQRRFGPDGSYRDAVILDEPTPGRPPTPTTPVAPTAPHEAAAAAGAEISTWLVLLSLGGGLLGGVIAQRVSGLAREHRG